MSRLRDRSRPAALAPVSFEMDGHRFEIIDRDLWVTLAGTEYWDRLKVTRSSVSRSARAGYPAELVWPRNVEDKTLPQLQSAARFWLAWRQTEPYTEHPERGLDLWLRRAEMKSAAHQAA